MDAIVDYDNSTQNYQINTNDSSIKRFDVCLHNKLLADITCAMPSVNQVKKLKRTFPKIAQQFPQLETFLSTFLQKIQQIKAVEMYNHQDPKEAKISILCVTDHPKERIVKLFEGIPYIGTPHNFFAVHEYDLFKKLDALNVSGGTSFTEDERKLAGVLQQEKKILNESVKMAQDRERLHQFLNKLD
jgi:hypothetical protein